MQPWDPSILCDRTERIHKSYAGTGKGYFSVFIDEMQISIENPSTTYLYQNVFPSA